MCMSSGQKSKQSAELESMDGKLNPIRWKGYFNKKCLKDEALMKGMFKQRLRLE